MSEERTFTVVLEKEFYGREAVFAAAGKFTHLAEVVVQPEGENAVAIAFRITAEFADPEAVKGQFLNEVLDQQARQDLERRNGHIRDIVYQHAFAPLANLKEALCK